MKVQTMVPEQNLALNLNQHTSSFLIQPFLITFSIKNLQKCYVPLGKGRGESYWDAYA